MKILLSIAVGVVLAQSCVAKQGKSAEEPQAKSAVSADYPWKYYFPTRTNYISDDGNLIVIGPDWCRGDKGSATGYGSYPMAILEKKNGWQGDPQIVFVRVVESDCTGRMVSKNEDQTVCLEENVMRGKLVVDGRTNALTRILKKVSHPSKPRLSPVEAVDIYAKSVDVWFDNESPSYGDFVYYYFADFDEDGVLELIREVNRGTGRVSDTTIFRIMSNNSIKGFILTRQRDWSCFFNWGGKMTLLRRMDGEVVWFLKGYTREGSAGPTHSYEWGTVRRHGTGFYGDNLAVKILRMFDDVPLFYCLRTDNLSSFELKDVSKSEYVAAIASFVANFEMIDARIPHIDIPHFCRKNKLGEVELRMRLSAAYGQFGYKGYPYQKVLDEFRKANEDTEEAGVTIQDKQ